MTGQSGPINPDEAAVEAAALALSQTWLGVHAPSDATQKGWQRAVRVAFDALHGAGYRVVKNDPNHYVCFTEDTWFIEHSLDCRIAGTIGTCEFNHSIIDLADDLPAPPDDLLGRWLITGIDEEGLPSLERA